MRQHIRFGEPFELTPPEEILPPNDLIIVDSGSNQRRSENFQIYIVDRVFGNIWEHLESNPDVEAGGLLVGHPFKCIDDPDITFVIITGAIRQDSDNRSVGHFTVGPRDIAVARGELEQKYPGLVVVGWYHSHPGHGVFLSGQDMQIVRSIYSADWHVALVIDPHQGERGKAVFFQGAEGKKVPGWIELKETPVSVTAMALYNQSQELLAQRQIETARNLLIDLKRLEEEQSMTHWRRRGGYRDVQTMWTQLSNDTTDINTNSNALALPAFIDADYDNDDEKKEIDEIPKELRRAYNAAKGKVEQAIQQHPPNLFRLKEAQQIFRQIHEHIPNNEGIELVNKLIDQIIEIYDRQQSIPSTVKRFKDLLTSLSELLQGRGQPTGKLPRRHKSDTYSSYYEERKRPSTKPNRPID